MTTPVPTTNTSTNPDEVDTRPVNPLPVKVSADVSNAAPAGGSGAPTIGEELPLPHEVDESIGSVAKAPDPVMQQAKRDLDAGLVDTDMRATPGLDAALRKKMVPGAGGTTPPLSAGS